MYELKNKVVLITGAANGIGAGLVKLFLEEGVKHVAILDLDKASGIEFQNELNAKFGDNKAKFFQCDVTKDDQLFEAFKSVVDENGYIDVVINNAGIMNDSLGSYKKEIEINVTALVTSTLKAIELMRKDEGGRGGTVINISSVAGLTQTPHMPIYWATKSAVLQFSNCIGHSEYYERTGVRVLAICFGATTTSLVTTEKLGSYDKKINDHLVDVLLKFPQQSIESAALGVVAAYQRGQSGSTWIVTSNKPAIDITETVNNAYNLMEEFVF